VRLTILALAQIFDSVLFFFFFFSNSPWPSWTSIFVHLYFRFFFLRCISLMCMSVLPVCLSVHHMHTWCL
jgi:hypothetical protein